MTRYVIHKSECPALCHKMFATNIPNVGDVAFLCEHLHGHACSGSCPSPEELAELVDELESVLKSFHELLGMRNATPEKSSEVLLDQVSGRE